MTTPFQPASTPYFGANSADAIFTAAMTRLYMWMTAGLVLTTVVGFAAYQVGIGLFGFLIALVLWIGILFGMRWASGRAPVRILLGLYFTFTAVGGVMLSGVAAYRVETLLFALALTGGVFVAMSVIGLTTKKDLTNWGPILGFALLGLVVMMMVNIFIGSSFIGWVVSSTALAGIPGSDDLRDQTGEGTGPGSRRRGRRRGCRQDSDNGGRGTVPELHQPIPDYPENYGLFRRRLALPQRFIWQGDFRDRLGPEPC